MGRLLSKFSVIKICRYAISKICISIDKVLNISNVSFKIYFTSIQIFIVLNVLYLIIYKQNSFDSLDFYNKLLDSDDRKYISFGPCAFDGRRTGNLLFTLAGLWFVAEKTNRTPVLPMDLTDDWIEFKKYFKELSVLRFPNKVLYDPGRSVSVEERYGPFGYDPLFENLHDNSTIKNTQILLLCGYFQNYKYVENVEYHLRDKYSFKEKYKWKVKQFFRNHKMEIRRKFGKKTIKTVGLHVRRGDFLISYNREQGLTVVDEHYINSTVRYFYNLMNKKGKVFIIYFVVSEDLDWVSSTIRVLNLGKLHNVVFIPSVNHEGLFDMCLVSMCDGVIMSTGTFSWWAAWLANTTTLYYKNYPKKDSPIALGFEIETYYKPEWIGFS
ncbi:hypothetical protein HELRODRAFT_164398 [Helobdella robusta]|uniref:L-Fucosyltransferase n=1 Tax=Helobdella robusta TaxID=6412 RepID=T1EVD8_HELRO|nr:hypothetical protein HELRODRAFT_164398 [Helobdella robusta]ESN94542.1 hypothetical protein HELRODRAFT_164398 [Helobdella robusta]